MQIFWLKLRSYLGYLDHRLLVLIRVLFLLLQVAELFGIST